MPSGLVTCANAYQVMIWPTITSDGGPQSLGTDKEE